jgi:hypothetical protein
MALRLILAGLCGAAIVATAVISAPASAQDQTRRTITKKQTVVTTKARQRVVVRPRSYLDGGTEVLPGERKFTDYAIPPTYSPVAPIQNTTFYRQPLPSPWDLPGRDAPWRLNPCVGC